MEITSWPTLRKTDHAIQDLIKSCRVQLPDESNSKGRYLEVKHACEELLGFTFQSEDGRLRVIENLTKLQGNFVVKIIRKGLSGLSKVYSEAKTFEEEALKLVELCCSQSEALRNGCEDGSQVASPAVIINWTVELCDQLVKAKEVSGSRSAVVMSLCLSELRNIYESIVRAKLTIDPTSSILEQSIQPSKRVFEVLKPRIQSEGFEELVKQTAAIVRMEEKLDFWKLSRSITLKYAHVLLKWLHLLTYSFLPNWWVIGISKQDFLVNDEVYVRSLPFTDITTYNESLICKVDESIPSNQKEFSCHKDKAQVLFDDSEIFLRHTSTCLQLIQSEEIGANLLKDLFYVLEIKLDRTLLPVTKKSDLQDFDVSPDITQITNLEQKYLTSCQEKLMPRRHQYSSFIAMTKALFILPDKQQVLNVVRIWKQKFPNDSSYCRLSELFELVNVATQDTKESMSNNMERLIAFLSHLPTEWLSFMSAWQPLLVKLIPTLPHSWNGPEVINLIERFVAIISKNLAESQSIEALEDVSTKKQNIILNFVDMSLKRASKSENVKTEVLKLGLELFEETPHPEEYEFVLNVILSIASDIEAKRIKTFTLSFLKAARECTSSCCYKDIWRVVRLIDHSCCIKSKSEILESYLKLLQEIKNVDLLREVINICCSFLQLPVTIHTDNTKRYFALAAKERLKCCHFILKCLSFNQQIIQSRDRVDNHVIFLFNVVEYIPFPNCDLFLKTIVEFMEHPRMSFNSIDVFEVMVASTAGSITVGTFECNRNAALLKVVHAADQSRHLDYPSVLSFSIRVGQIIDQAKRLGERESFVNHFAIGLCLVARLPLPLHHIIQLMDKVTKILDQERITDEQELNNVMFHLFHLPDNVESTSVDSNDLNAHFEKILKTSTIRSVAKIPLMTKVVTSDSVQNTRTVTLMEVLVERMPQTFSERTSSSLYKFIVKRVEENPQLVLSVFPVVEAVTKRCVSEVELKNEIEEIEENLLRVSPAFIPLISKCLTECYIDGLGEKQSVKDLILQILESLYLSELNVDDGLRMINGILGIPKLLVKTFKVATSPEEAKNGMSRIFDVVSKLDPSIITGDFCAHRLKRELEGIIQHDFHTLMKQSTCTVVDLCTALLLYRNPNLVDLLSFHEELPNTSDTFKALTPGSLAYLVIQQLRRLNISDTDIKDTTLEICSKFLQNVVNLRPMIGGLPSSDIKEYIDFFFVIMKESTHLDEIRYWLKIECQLAVQCRSVITAACLWSGSGNKSCEEVLRMNNRISETLRNLKYTVKVSPEPFMLSEVHWGNDLEVMARVIKTCNDEEVVCNLLELLCTSRQSAETCLDIIPLWAKEESIILIHKIMNWYKERNMEINSGQLSNEARIPLQVLPYAAKAFPNSAKEVFDFFVKMIESNGPEDHLSLGRLPVWSKKMTDDGYDSQAIQSWCTCLVMTPNLCSSDIDSIANLTPETIQFLSNSVSSNEIKKSLFCLEVTKSLQNDKDTLKRCLIRARLLNEFACIGGQLKENSKVVDRIKKGVKELCSYFLPNASATGNMYKIRYNVLKDLLVLLFEGEENIHSPKQLTNKGPLSKSIVILFRRLARSVVTRPKTFALMNSIVHTMLNHDIENLSSNWREIQDVVHELVLHFESNQDAIHTLQAADYNQSTSTKEDLWYSLSIQMTAYVPTMKSFGASRMESLLRQLWREWKTILSAHNITEIEVGGKTLKNDELFETTDSLETMESQLHFVQQALQSKPLMQNNWGYYRQKELIRSEKRLRKKIDEQVKEIDEMTVTQLTRLVLVWENRLLESVKVCSEKIPDCYAPNGFHSEKPVICGIAVDNRILTLYKEDDSGTRTEVENVEVKLYPAGMLVFGVFRSIHPYDTEQLWAAFYKMLLDKRLVPKIFITNVSPAFDWLKQFIAPETSVPPHFSFTSCCDLIPSSEDSLDYDPNLSIHRLNTLLADASMKELIILTQENVRGILTSKIKAPIENRKSIIKEQMDQAENHMDQNSTLQEMHPELKDRKEIIKRLKTPIRKAIEFSMDGGEPTVESISKSIDMRRLLPSHSQDAQPSKKVYSSIILVSVNKVNVELRGNEKPYNGCEHVVFLQRNEK